MRTDISYEIIDGRTISGRDKLGSVGVIQTLPVGLVVKSSDLSHYHFDMSNIPDDEVPFDDLEESGRVILGTKDGPIILERLALANYHERVLPFVKDVPKFATDEEVNAFFYKAVTDAE